MLPLLAAYNEFKNTTLYRVSSKELRLTLEGDDSGTLSNFLLSHYSQAVLLSEDCEYYANFTVPRIDFYNASCLLENQTFYRLVIRSALLQANITLYIDRIVQDISALSSCLKTIQLYHNQQEDLKLWIELDCPGIQIDSDILIALLDEDSIVFYTNLTSASAFVVGTNISVQADSQVRRYVVYNYSYVLEYYIYASKQTLLEDQSTNSTFPVQWIVYLYGKLRNSLFDGFPCFSDVGIAVFEKNVIIKTKHGLLCSPGAGSYYEQFGSDTTYIQLIVEFQARSVVLYNKESGYNFGLFEYWFSCTEDCAEYYFLSSQIRETGANMLYFNVVFFHNDTAVGMIRHFANYVKPLFSGLSAVSHMGRVCVSANEQPQIALSVIKEYSLWFRRSPRGKKLPYLQNMYYYSFSDFFPLDEYCFDVGQAKLILSLFQAQYDIVFSVDDRYHLIYDFEPHIPSQQVPMTIALTTAMIIPLALLIFLLKTFYHGVS